MTANVARIHPSTQALRNDYAANREALPGAGLAWLDSRRAHAMEAFAKTGVPTRRVEAWKYSDLANVLDAALLPALSSAAAPESGRDPFGGIADTTLTFVDGFLDRASLGQVKGSGLDIVDLGVMSEQTPLWVQRHLGAQANDRPLAAVSLALMRGGVALRVARGSSGKVHLRFVSPAPDKPRAAHGRVVIVVEEGATLSLLESHTGGGAVQTLANLGMDLIVEKSARVDHIRLQDLDAHAVEVTSLNARVLRDGRYTLFAVSAGARMSRFDANVILADPGAEANLSGVIVHGAQGHSDVTIVMDHAAPHTKSRQMVESVLGGNAHGVTQGLVHVREGAVKSDSHQLFKALLLGERAEADAKPELEIYADDVVCGHGTAIGALDEDALFYLKARGIPEDEARQMLVRAYLEDALQSIADVPVHDALWAAVEASLDSLETAP